MISSLDKFLVIVLIKAIQYIFYRIEYKSCKFELLNLFVCNIFNESKLPQIKKARKLPFVIVNQFLFKNTLTTFLYVIEYIF